MPNKRSAVSQDALYYSAHLAISQNGNANKPVLQTHPRHTPLVAANYRSFTYSPDISATCAFH
ncbi:MAG: hypothetical protein K9G33_07705 [Sneathiella sp.]|nr:hypothetical protein [Sneathiella sp.]